jgi:hypothetical protein
LLQKYNDPSSPIITLSIKGVEIPNFLIDLWVSINVITSKIVEMLKMTTIQPTRTILQLANGQGILKVSLKKL